MTKPQATKTTPTPPPAPTPTPVVLKAVPAVFGASISVQGSAGPSTFTKKELISALQKGVRRQNFRLAAQAACCLFSLADAMIVPQMRQSLLTNLANRIVIISKEDCAESPGSFHHAYRLWEKREELARDDVLRVLQYMCTHGTSRLGSHMRAYHPVWSGDLQRELIDLLKQVTITPFLQHMTNITT